MKIFAETLCKRHLSEVEKKMRSNSRLFQMFVCLFIKPYLFNAMWIIRSMLNVFLLRL